MDNQWFDLLIAESIPPLKGYWWSCPELCTTLYVSPARTRTGSAGGTASGAGEYAAPVFGESSGPVWTGDAAPIEDGGQDGESEATRHMSNAQLGLE